MPACPVIIIIFKKIAVSIFKLELVKCSDYCIGQTFSLNCTVPGTKLILTSTQYIGPGGTAIEFGKYSQTLPLTDSRGAAMATLHSIEPLMATLSAKATQDGTILCLDDTGLVHLNVTITISKLIALRGTILLLGFTIVLLNNQMANN